MLESFLLLLSVLEAPTCELCDCIAAHLSECVVIPALGPLDQSIQKVLDLGMLTDAIPGEPAHELETKRLKQLARDVLNLRRELNYHWEQLGVKLGKGCLLLYSLTVTI